MRQPLAIVVAASLALVALPAAAEEGDPSAPLTKGAGGPLAPSKSHSLGEIHGGTTASGANVAGQARDVTLADKPVATAVVRPAATPRVLKRMRADQVVATIETSARACASENPSAAPSTIRVRVSVTPVGEVESAAPAAGAKESPALLACVEKYVKSARFGAPGGSGAAIVVPVVVPARAGIATTERDATSEAKSATESKPEVVAAKP